MVQTKIKESQISDLAHDITVKDSGVTKSSTATTLDFIGGITASGSGSTITISGGSGGAVEIQEDDVQVVSEAIVVNFEGSVDVTDEGSGKVTVSISGGSGSSTFTALTDTPSSYTGYAGQAVVVTSGATGVEFSRIGSGQTTKFLWFPIIKTETSVLYGQEKSYFPVQAGDNTEHHFMNFAVPDDFDSLVEIVAVGLGGADNTNTFTINGSLAAFDEAYSTHDSTDTTDSISIYNTKVFEVDVSSVFTNMAAGDYGALRIIKTDDELLQWMGLKLVYKSNETLAAAGIGNWLETISLRRTSADDLSTGAWHDVDWEAAEREDWEAWEGVTNPERIVLDETGVYLVVGQMLWEAGTGSRYVRVVRNGNDSYEIIESSVDPGTDTIEGRHSFSGIIQADAGDYIELQVYHDRGSNCELRGGAEDAEATRVWISKLKSRSFTEATFSNVYVYLGTHQEDITNGADVQVLLDTELWDLGNEFNTSTSVFTANNAGYYQINYSARLISLAGSATTFQSKVYHNTSTLVLIAESYATNGDYVIANGAGTVYLDADDTIHLSVKHSSGSSNEDIQGHRATTYLNIYRVA